MRILIFDSNRVFARCIGRLLERHLRHPVVDYAYDPAVLRQRLADDVFDLVLADIETTDTDAATDALRGVGSPVVLWSFIDRCAVHALTAGNGSAGKANCLRKPSLPEEYNVFLSMIEEKDRASPDAETTLIQVAEPVGVST
jgi:DNA-binding NarL/FixJ family response regulator